MSSIASPSSSSSALNVVATGSRVVRFDSQCILIPEVRSKRPKMVTRSYSLSLWKKKSSDTDSFDDSADDSHLTFKVPVPSFMTKARSPSRGRSADLSQPLSSCLANSDTPHIRRPSVSLPPQYKYTTVPLRACCQDCVNATEKCLKEGELWQEKFSLGAYRRRSTSLDTASTVIPSASAFSAAVTSTFPERFSLTVDEVDRRRRLYDYASDDTPAHQGDGSVDSSTSTVDDASSLSIRKSPIPEEDEDQLFPLPSPRRTPNASPNGSPIPTPNASTSSLTLLKYPKASSKSFPSTSRDSLPSGSDESPVSHTAPAGRQLLTPDVSPEPHYHVPASLQAKPLPVISIPPPCPPATHPGALPPPCPPSPPPARACAPTPPPSPLVSRPRKEPPEASIKRRPSFAMPSPAALLKAGAGALKGVNSIGSAGWG